MMISVAIEVALSYVVKMRDMKRLSSHVLKWYLEEEFQVRHLQKERTNFTVITVKIMQK